MKTIFFSLLLALVILFSGISAIAGASLMTYDLYSGGPNFMHGFEIFCFGSILFFTASTAYIATKILAGTDTLVDVMTSYFNNEIKQQQQNNENPLQNLLGGLKNIPGVETTIKIAKMDEDGNITPINDEDNNFPEDFMKNHNEMVSKLLGDFSGKSPKKKKKLEDMTIDELKETRFC